MKTKSDGWPEVPRYGAVNDGGPAFPFGQVSETTGQPINGFFNPGMSLRDWFAGQALSGLMANPSFNGNILSATTDAFSAADSMIESR